MYERPAAAAPHFWTNSGAAADKPTLVWLTDDSLTLAVVPGADLEHMIAAVKNGEAVAGLVIPLASLAGASADEDSAQLTIAFKASPSKEEAKAIDFADKADRGLLAGRRGLVPLRLRHGVAADDHSGRTRRSMLTA